MTDEVRLATRTMAPAAAYESANFAFRNGRSAGSAPWFMSMTRWPRARSARIRAFGRIRGGAAAGVSTVSARPGARRATGPGSRMRAIVAPAIRRVHRPRWARRRAPVSRNALAGASEPAIVVAAIFGISAALHQTGLANITEVAIGPEWTGAGPPRARIERCAGPGGARARGRQTRRRSRAGGAARGSVP